MTIPEKLEKGDFSRQIDKVFNDNLNNFKMASKWKANLLSSKFDIDLYKKKQQQPPPKQNKEKTTLHYNLWS